MRALASNQSVKNVQAIIAVLKGFLEKSKGRKRQKNQKQKKSDVAVQSSKRICSKQNVKRDFQIEAVNYLKGINANKSIQGTLRAPDAKRYV